MKMQEKYKALRVAVNRYIEQNLLNESYYIDAKLKSKIYILDKENSIIAKAIILPSEIAIIPVGMYGNIYPVKVFKIDKLI